MDFHASLVSTSNVIWVIAFSVFLTLLHVLYRFALPRPIRGIPYNEASSRRLLGDVPAISSHMASTEGGTFITYIMETMKTLNAPLIQVFIRPLSRPLLILADFPEAHDLLVRRKEFDRSHTLGDLVQGLAPDHHIHLKTNAEWKAQRRLVQDLMTPSFLHNVAGPAILQKVSTMIEMWRVKSRIADGRPWVAGDDMNQMALDAVTAFAFGRGFEHSATKPALEAVKAWEKAIATEKSPSPSRDGSDLDKPIEFPRSHVDSALQATLDLTETVGEVQGNPVPALTWAYVTRKPQVKRAIRIKEEYIMKELRDGVARMEKSSLQSDVVVESAIDQMIVREKSLAEKDGRAPDYFSRVMIDETFGFVFAGHETTSTTLCWALKYLADSGQSGAQIKLRKALQSAFPTAKSEGRDPTIQEITSAHIPYLDATMEETLRCAGTAPVVDRVALVDTELLSHHIPKGTVVTCLVTGPSMMSPGFDIDESSRSPTSRSALKEGRDRSWDPADMSVFQPDRWIKKKKKKMMMTTTTTTMRNDVGNDVGNDVEEFDASAGPQLAFGLGTRGCYGKRLAYLEMKILLTLVLCNFELLPCPPQLSHYDASLITTNEPKQCYVRLRPIT